MSNENQNITLTDNQVSETKLDKEMANRFFKAFCSIPAKQQSMIASGVVCMETFGKAYKKMLRDEVRQQVIDELNAERAIPV